MPFQMTLSFHVNLVRSICVCFLVGTMSNYDDLECAKLRDSFTRQYKRIQTNAPKTKNQPLLDDYRNEIVIGYNRYVEYIANAYSEFNEEKKQQNYEQVRSVREKLIKAFQILSLTYDFNSNIFA